MEIEDFEAIGLIVHVDQGDQHEHRAEEGIEEKLESGIDSPRSPPDADNQKHRNQHRFEKHVEQQRVQGSEYPDHQPFHDQEGSHVLRDPILDHFPTRDHDHDRHEGGQQDQRHRKAIHSDMVVGIERRNPWDKFLKLHGGGGVIKSRVQRHTDQERQDCHR